MSTAAPERPTGRWHEVLILAAICVVALTVRLLFLSDWAGTPLFKYLTGDELNFHNTALSLLGLGPGDQSFLYEPLYSFYLVLIYGLFGVNVVLVRTLQLFLGIGTCLLFYGLGREVGGRWVGRLSALAVALYGPLVFFEGSLLDPGITVPLLAGGFWCLLVAARRNRLWLLLPAGVLVGLVLMGRPNLAACLPAAALWLCWRDWKWPRRALAVALAVFGVALGLSPSWIHNAVRGEAFSPVSAAGGISFFIGSNPDASGRFHIPSGERIDGSSHEAYRNSLAATAEQAEGRKLTTGEVSSYWYRRGLGFWREQPGAALALVGKKLLLAVSHDEMPIHHSYVFGAELAPVLRVLPGFAVFFPFAVLGLVLRWRRNSAMKLLGWCALLYLLTLLAFYVADRYRIMLLPMLLPISAAGMVGLAERFRERGWRGSWVPLVVLLLSFGLTQVRFMSQLEQTKALSSGYNLMGKVEGDRGNLREAETYFRRAVELAGPRHGSLARGNLGLLLERQGDLEAARVLYLDAASLDSENRFVREKLARLEERMGHPQEALRWWKELRGLLADPSPADQEIRRLESQPPKPAP